MQKPFTHEPSKDCAPLPHPQPRDDGWTSSCVITAIDNKVFIDCKTDNSYSHSKVNPMPLPKVEILFEPVREHKVDGHNPDNAVQGNVGTKFKDQSK